MEAVPVTMTHEEPVHFPVDEWMTTDQAESKAEQIARDLALPRIPKLDGHDLRKHCRERFAAMGLAVFIGKEGIITGRNDYTYTMGGRGVWLVHQQAVELRLRERSRGRGNPNFRKPGQPGVRPTKDAAASE